MLAWRYVMIGVLFALVTPIRLGLCVTGGNAVQVVYDPCLEEAVVLATQVTTSALAIATFALPLLVSIAPRRQNSRYLEASLQVTLAFTPSLQAPPPRR